MEIDENTKEHETAKRKSKDSVFVDLFTDKKYVLQLYKDLHPEDTSVKLSDIEVKTLNSVMINRRYNDLGFIVKDKLIMLVEAQSAWNPNITFRMLEYLIGTWSDYLDETGQSVHSSKVKLPRPELYVVYTGSANIPNEVSFNDDFFGGTAPVDVKVKVLRTADTTIYGQYIIYCNVFDEQRKTHKNTLKCIEETIRICIDRGVLAEYLAKHKKEVVTMMREMFDEDYLRERYYIAERKRIIAEGIAEGKAAGMAEGKAAGIAEGKAEVKSKIIAKLIRKGFSRDDILDCAEITNKQYDEYLRKFNAENGNALQEQ